MKEDEYLNSLQCKEVKNEDSDSDSDGSIQPGEERNYTNAENRNSIKMEFPETTEQ